MNISFDLDSTLIPIGNEFETENQSYLAKCIGIEKIRKSTRLLFTNLKHQGCQVHIYTTSFRSRFKIRITFWFYGIRVNKIITQFENEQKLKLIQINASKYPPAFDFDVHIDDSLGVEAESKRFGFNVITIQPQDIHWTERVLTGLNDIILKKQLK